MYVCTVWIYSNTCRAVLNQQKCLTKHNRIAKQRLQKRPSELFLHRISREAICANMLTWMHMNMTIFYACFCHRTFRRALPRTVHKASILKQPRILELVSSSFIIIWKYTWMDFIDIWMNEMYVPYKILRKSLPEIRSTLCGRWPTSPEGGHWTRTASSSLLEIHGKRLSSAVSG